MNAFSPIAFACALVAATPASAQRTVPVQSLIAEFGDCVVAQHPGRAREALRTEAGSDDERDAMRSLLRAEGCLHRPVQTFQFLALRAAVAEAVVKRDDARLASIRGLSESTPARVPDLLDGREFVAAYAFCITIASPQRTVDLIRTVPGSPDERAAMTAFGAILMDCMPHGARYRMNITDLRNHMALDLFRMSEATGA
jgi:hypothetical protein